jgi:hypothetical protein
MTSLIREILCNIKADSVGYLRPTKYCIKYATSKHNCSSVKVLRYEYTLQALRVLMNLQVP